ncbi:Hypothetical predicted protein [Podarcis lilfordi]|uniref:Uncharacterized protein n=1 Tax=Podarcis lilfordi TaxID=74358 RepID=A0AA35W231_9SAUR|nr:Hypothetical predicted protein [Podarcis lilfordi]
MDAAAAPPGSGRRAGIGSLSEGDVTPDGRGEGRLPLRLNASLRPARGGPSPTRPSLPGRPGIATWALSPLTERGVRPTAGQSPPSLPREAGYRCRGHGSTGAARGSQVLEPGSQPAASRSPTSPPLSRQRPEGPWHGIGEGGCSPLLRGNRVGRRACPAPWVYTDRGARLGRLRFPPEEPRRTPRLPPPWVYTGRGARLGRLRFNQKYRVRRRACPRRGSTLAGERGWVVCGSPEGPENPVARNLRAHAVLARREQMASRAPAPAPRQAGVSEAPGGQTRQARSDRGASRSTDRRARLCRATWRTARDRRPVYRAPDLGKPGLPALGSLRSTGWEGWGLPVFLRDRGASRSTHRKARLCRTTWRTARDSWPVYWAPDLGEPRLPALGSPPVYRPGRLGFAGLPPRSWGFPVYPPESAALPGYLAYGAEPLGGLLGAGPR